MKFFDYKNLIKFLKKAFKNIFKHSLEIYQTNANKFYVNTPLNYPRYIARYWKLENDVGDQRKYFCMRQ